MKVKRGAQCLCLLGCLALSGCSRTPEPVDSVIVSDSAGIRIVESRAPQWLDPSQSWSVDPVPEVEIRSDFGAPDHYLFRAGYVQRLSDGRIVVGNRGTRQLFIFDASGQFLRAAGGPGEGPGEFQHLFGLFKCATDTLVVLELNRLSVLDRDGSFLRTIPLYRDNLPRSRVVNAVSSDCGAALFTANAPRPALTPGVVGVPATLLWGSFDETPPDTLSTLVAAQYYLWERGGEIFDLQLPFAELATWSASGDRVFVGPAGGFEVHVFDRDGSRGILRWASTREPVTARDRAALSDWLLDLFEENPEAEAYWPPLESLPLPATKPPYARLLAADDGVLWVQQAGVWPDNAADWWVFDADGYWLGSVAMPAGLRVVGIDMEFVIGVFRDELDMENIRLHRLTKPTG